MLSQIILITLGSSFHFLTSLARKEKPDLFFMLRAKQGSIWYHFYKVIRMTRLWMESRPPAHGANGLPLSYRCGLCHI